MKLFYIDNIVDESQVDAEYYYFIINYLIGEKIHIHSNTGLYIYGIRNANKLTNFEFLNYHENYWIHEKGDPEVELDRIFKVKDNYHETNKYVKALKSKKHLNKLDIAVINSKKKLVNMAKENVLGVYKSMLQKLQILPYMDLINDEIFKISFSMYTRKNVVLDENIGELIYKTISIKENLFVLGSMFRKQMKMFCEAEETETEEEGKNMVTLGSILLFTIPCSPNLTKENLLVLRKQFQSKIDALFLKIQDLRIEFIEMQLNELIIAKFDEFEVLIKQELKAIQSDIDNHVYLQSIKNSDSNYKKINVYLGIIPPDLLLMVYGSLGVLTFEKLLELRHRTANAKGKRDVDIYINYIIESEDNE